MHFPLFFLLSGLSQYLFIFGTMSLKPRFSVIYPLDVWHFFYLVFSIDFLMINRVYWYFFLRKIIM